MSRVPAFFEASPEVASTQLDADSIHLWRLPYQSSQRRTPLLALLSAYLGTPASDIALTEDARGKPRLAHPALEFNWSHSGDYALVALARHATLGVDIERLGKNLRALEIARRFFDPAEAEALASLEPEARDHAFVGLWCAKEAVLKAQGEGLSFGLERLAFTRRSDADWELASLDPALGKVNEWQLAGFAAAPGYRGALAWRGKPCGIRAFRAP